MLGHLALGFELDWEGRSPSGTEGARYE